MLKGGGIGMKNEGGGGAMNFGGMGKILEGWVIFFLLVLQITKLMNLTSPL